MSRIVFVDTEVSIDSGKVCDYGAINAENEELHTKSEKEFTDFIRKGIFPFGDRFICGHNIIAHDLRICPHRIKIYAKACGYAK